MGAELMLWIILVAQLELFGSYKDAPAFKEWFEKAKVGDSYEYSIRSDCNSCFGEAVKVSETEVRDMGITSCTLVNCWFGQVIKVK